MTTPVSRTPKKFPKTVSLYCNKYPVQSCANCAYTCNDQEGVAWCVEWKPGRSGHPSTPNPCEGFGTSGLCFNECLGCRYYNTKG